MTLDEEYIALCADTASKFIGLDNCPDCGREHAGEDENHAEECAMRPLSELRYDDEEGLA